MQMSVYIVVGEGGHCLWRPLVFTGKLVISMDLYCSTLQISSLEHARKLGEEMPWSPDRAADEVDASTSPSTGPVFLSLKACL